MINNKQLAFLILTSFMTVSCSSGPETSHLKIFNHLKANPSSEPLLGSYERGAAALLAANGKEEAQAIFKQRGIVFVTMPYTGQRVPGFDPVYNEKQYRRVIEDSSIHKVVVPATTDAFSAGHQEEYLNAARKYSAGFNKWMYEKLKIDKDK